MNPPNQNTTLACPCTGMAMVLKTTHNTNTGLYYLSNCLIGRAIFENNNDNEWQRK
jgi:hypothetical protein